MIRCYVAGPYSADNVIDVLKNIGRGQQACAELFRRGFAPFCPWHDASYVMDHPDDDFTIQQFYDYSMAWLEVSDCMFILPGWSKSQGTMAEMDRACDLGIPIFQTEYGLLEWARGQK